MKPLTVINPVLDTPSLLKPRKLFNRENLDSIIKLLIVALGLLIIVTAYNYGLLSGWSFYKSLRYESPFLYYLLIINSFIFLLALVFRTVLWFRYREYDSAQVSDWPEVTIFVPAFNEGETVYKTLCSIVRCDYPPDKLRIIAIDDGSGDDTHVHLIRAQNRYPEKIKVIRFDTNKGKREALYQAFKNSASPFVITVDSDTRLKPNAIKELLTPMIINPKLAAVTGRIRIWNRSANIFTRILHVNFAMAFDFTRAIQSTFSTVFCTSGAFSAYRSDILERVLDNWLNQTFLKRSCTYGEDRSLANHVLRLGHGTVFQRTAIAYTLVPVTLYKILKMLTRWARSNIRESVIFSRFMFNANRKGNYLLPGIEFFSTTVMMFFHLLMFYYFLFSGIVSGEFILRVLAYTVIFGFFYMLYYVRIERFKDIPYVLALSLFCCIFNVWIFTVACLTVRTRRWSTR